ncbi:ElaB/YqjD/DUF883 family membrane-anchored ribosome-binding protein [Parvibaculum indicum]|uniref:hypothetical protein n=1 Tax=Parvibaculum indicum TaxID=562969 RepID=UPI001420D389|nr:hypothetical protein [Parvibaculum indicum]NIJ41309.1 ElaB/YqjD/DUF883 family membrane-anchored ribosome-binding protein [Parvibaculum indicum]
MSNFTKTALAIIVIAIILVIGYQMMNPSDDVMTEDQGTSEMAPADEGAAPAEDAAPAAEEAAPAAEESTSGDSMMDQAGEAAEATGEAIQDGAEATMDAAEDAAEATGDAMEDAAQDANDAMNAEGMGESEEPADTEAPKPESQPAE